MKTLHPQTSSPGDDATLWENQLTDLLHHLRQIDEDVLHMNKQLLETKNTLQQLRLLSSKLVKKAHETQKHTVQSERLLEDLTNIVEHDHAHIFERLEKLEKMG